MSFLKLNIVFSEGPLQSFLGLAAFSIAFTLSISI